MNTRILFNPYLGAICGSTTFYNLFKLVPEKEYNNPVIMGFVVLKTFTTGFIGSFVPITAFFVGKELYTKYKDLPT